MNNIFEERHESVLGLPISKGRLPKLSVVMPVYNEGNKISACLTHVKRVFDNMPQSYEIIIVDDGSWDDTLSILQQEKESDPRLTVISYAPNMGKGYAIRTGVLKSSGDIIILLDSDGEVCPETVKDYLCKINDYDMAIGSKEHPLSG